MGFFSDDEPQQSPADTAVQQQIAQDKATLEEKKKSLYSQRLSILRTQGAPNWNPTPQAPSPNLTSRGSFGGKPLGWGRLIDSAMGQARGTSVGKQPTVG